MDPVYIQLSRYTQPAIIILGTIGAVFNQILFFSRKQLRSTSCSLYFRALSANDLLVLYIVILTQWLRDQFGLDLTVNYNWCCKLSTYLTLSLYTLSPYFVVLACFDRLCTSSTNARLRRIATLRVASFLISSMFIVVFAVYIYVPIQYELKFSLLNSSCSPINYNYYLIFAQILLIFTCFMPPILMLILCSITLILLRRQRRRVMPVNQARLRQRDNQLLKMLIIYLISNITFMAPFSITYFIQIYYLQNTPTFLKNTIQLFNLLVNINYATSFYLYTLGTPFYRDELYNLIKTIWQRIHRTDIIIINQPT